MNDGTFMRTLEAELKVTCIVEVAAIFVVTFVVSDHS